jgi:hypothetical protein
MEQICQCWWQICREINVFCSFKYHMFYFLYPYVTSLVTLPRIIGDKIRIWYSGCIIIYVLIHSLTELSPSWGAANFAATQKLPSILWNSKVHHHVHRTLPLVPIQSQINPVHTIPSYRRSILILSTHLHLGLPSGLFPSGFSTKILYACSSPPFVLHVLSILSSLTWLF